MMLKFILKMNRQTHSMTTTQINAIKRPRPILKKNLGKATDKQIIKAVTSAVIPKAYVIICVEYPCSAMHKVAPKGNTTML